MLNIRHWSSPRHHVAGRPRARQAVFLVMAALFAVLALRPCHAEEAAFSVQQLTATTFAAIAADKPGRIGANAGFVIGDDAVLVIDSFDSEAAAQALLDEIHKRTALPVRYLVNTHYHLDHLGGNAVFRKAGATIIAQRGVRPRVSENIKFFGANPAPALREMVDALAAPDLLFDEKLSVYLGKLEVRLLNLPGHTGSDTVVIVPQARTVFTGDLVWNETIPNLVDADVSSWIRTLQRLKAPDGLEIGTVVPGHGRSGSPHDVDAFKTYLQTLVREVGEGKSRGLSGDALVDAVLAKMRPTYGSWKYGDFFARANVRRVESDPGVEKR